MHVFITFTDSKAYIHVFITFTERRLTYMDL